VRVLSDISGQAGSLATAITDRWLQATGGAGEARAAERRLVLATARLSLLALVVLVAVLPLFLAASVALPVAVAVVLAAFLTVSTGLVGWHRSIAAEAERAERENAARKHAAADPFELCPGLVLVIDDKGTVLSVGGRDRDDYLPHMADPAGRGFLEQIHVSDRLAFLQAIDRIRQGEGRASVDLRLEPAVPGAGRDGQFSPVRLDMSAMTDAAGELASLFCQMVDISGETALRRETARRTAEAERANESKSRFLAAVSHELRTPLNAILGFSDILLGEYFGRLADDRQREYVGLIRQSGGHLLSVVNTMLDMSKIEAGRYELIMEAFEAAEPIRACENMLALQAREKGVTLTSRIGRDLGEVVADRRALSQVLINLVGNAIKFTLPGGVVSVDASRAEGKLRIVVSDTGIGIEEDKLALIGQPFMQIQNSYTRAYEGTGLGLSLVKGLVALHGGEFRIASRPGEGTVITVLLPDDGSGAPALEEDAARPVEFPPRLGGMRKGTEAQEEASHHGTAKAQSA
jgi:cell cycle sensor histidine kinase DivJ